MTDEKLDQLMDAWLTGDLGEDEAARLSDHLREHEAGRARLIQLADVHASLSVDESLWMPKGEVSPPIGNGVVKGWFVRHPLASAAFGIVLGTFFTSIVFASITTRAPEVKRVSIPLGNPGFESAPRNDQNGIPKSPGEWSGDISGITSGESGVDPWEGAFMLRVEPRGPKEIARLYQVVDLTKALPGKRDGVIDLEVSASFNSLSPSGRHLYGIHLMALDEPLDRRAVKIHSELADAAVASASQLIKVDGGDNKWQRVTVKIEVPPSASRLLICLFARGRLADGSEAKRYIDDVKLWMISPQF